MQNALLSEEGGALPYSVGRPEPTTGFREDTLGLRSAPKTMRIVTIEVM
jgi:hypothetical protein